MKTYLEELWCSLYITWDKNGGSEMSFLFTTTALVIGLSYFIPGLFFLFCDLHSETFSRFKIHQRPKASVDLSTLARLFKVLLINSVVTLCVLPVAIHVQMWCGVHASCELPSLRELLLHMFVHLAVEDMGFYCTHKILHTPFMYKAFHKHHHEWKSPIGLASAYFHPVELLLNGLLPIVLGPCLLGSHIVSALGFYFLLVSGSVIQHSGYYVRIPLFPSSKFHDAHHKNSKVNFGALGGLDCLLGTYQSAAEKMYRHKNKI